MLTLNERIVSFVSLNSAAINEMAGENMLEARGEIKVMALIKLSNAHFLLEAKFWGFLGSSCPSQPTMPRSRSVSGNGSRLITGVSPCVSTSEFCAMVSTSLFENDWRSCVASFWVTSMGWRVGMKSPNSDRGNSIYLRKKINFFG